MPIIAIPRVDIYLLDIRLNSHTMPFAGLSGMGRLISDHVLIANGPAGMDHGFLRLGCIAHAEMKARSGPRSQGFAAILGRNKAPPDAPPGSYH